MNSFIINNLNIKKDYVKNPIANIVLIHGLAEYLETFDDFVDVLNKNNINVIRFDLKGHGKSLGKRGYIKNINEYLNDLNYIINIIKKDNKNLKTFIYGYSLGAGILNAYSLNYNDFDGAISHAGPFCIPKVYNKYKLIPNFILKKIKIKVRFELDSGYTNNLDFFYKRLKDEKILKYFYATTPFTVMKYGDKIIKSKKLNTNIPYLFLHGKKDNLVKLSTSYVFYNYINSKDKEFFIQEDGMHDLLNDKENKITKEKIINWIKKHI